MTNDPSPGLRGPSISKCKPCHSRSRTLYTLPAICLFGVMLVSPLTQRLKGRAQTLHIGGAGSNGMCIHNGNYLREGLENAAPLHGREPNQQFKM